MVVEIPQGRCEVKNANVGALKHYRKKKLHESYEKRAKEKERHEQEMVKVHLREALKMLGISAGTKSEPLDIMELTYDEQVSLLERYADKLMKEFRVFKKKYGMNLGKHGLRWMSTEIDAVIASLARTRIQRLKEKHQPRRL